MDCNLEALATLMLFHIKVSLFYPFDSQRLDFVKIIVIYKGERGILYFFLKNQTIDFCNISHKIPEILIIIMIKVSLIRHS
jgi:hypothetical protein